MKILSMTATFGKLEKATLSLKDDLHIIEAPNEWGKSTWCAFILAMLYGIDTRERTKTGSLADKERYTPWSGSPMAGRMDIDWNGRRVTIERSTKGRSIMGVFRAYETDTGLDVPELTAHSCGQTLLGVEKEVFKRAGFLRLSEMQVTDNEALRSRLNALVTTGDESGTADALAGSLRELKNRVRSNSKNGLLPQAEARRDDLEATLLQLHQLRGECESIRARQTQLSQQRSDLENHICALDHAESQAYHQKLYAARADHEAAQEKEKRLSSQCRELPPREVLQDNLGRLRTLRQRKDELRSQLPVSEPVMPASPAFFQGLTAEDALRLASTDAKVYRQTQEEAKKRLLEILGLILAVAGLPALLISHWTGILLCAVAVVAGITLWRVGFVSRKRAAETAKALSEKYSHIPTEQWESMARSYGENQTRYNEQLASYRAARHAEEQKAAALESELGEFTKGNTLSYWEQVWTDALSSLSALEEARRETLRTADLVQALESSRKEALPPKETDTLTLSRAETLQQLAQCNAHSHQLQLTLGQCQGRMEELGQEDVLRKELAQVQLRIARLNATLDALQLAQDTLVQATAQLQRRFAPQIARQALSYFGRLTGGRYDRLTLAADLTVHAGAQDESTLHEALWRSEGTVDQLYLALRLAVAEALTPDAPLILDDALVRFDDKRLAAAMKILKELAQSKQVILFTCQSRENAAGSN